MLIGGDHTVHDTWRLVRFRLPFAVQRHFDGLRGTAVARATVALPTTTRCWRFPYFAFHHFNWVVQILWPHNPSSSSIPILLRAVIQTLPLCKHAPCKHRTFGYTSATFARKCTSFPLNWATG